MPEFDGALVRSADNAMLVNLNKSAGSQIRGVGIFASISGTAPNRNSLPSNNQVDGYIAVIQDVDKVYIFHGDPTTNWTNTANWTELGAGSSVSSDSFSTISVSGQSDVVADGAESTVEFIAGTNINVTNDATNDTVTFATPAELTADITGNAETVTTTADATNSFRSVVFTATTGVDADMLVDGNFRYNPYTNTLSISGIANPDDDVVINLGGSSTDATFTGNVTGDVTGNADTSTKFAASVNIGGVAFDGSASIDLPGVNTAGTQNTIGQAGTVAALTGLDTDDLAEGSTNLFFTSAEQTKLANIDTGAQVNAVDSVNSQTGPVVLDADDISDAATTNKFTTASDITKLANIATGATANDTDANLKNRSNHTGTQLASTISNFNTSVTNNATVADHTSKLAVIKPKVDNISVTQAVDLDDMESDISSNTTTITNIENVLKSTFTGGGAGIYTDSNKGTSDSFLGLTSTAAIFQAGGNTKVSMSETSPGNIDLFVQAGSAGNEAAYKAFAIDGSNSSATADIALNGAVSISGTLGNVTTIGFNKQASPPTAIAGGLYADTSDNLYFGIS